MTATPMEGLRLTASYDRDSRDNKTPVRSYPVVTTDMLVGATPRSNTGWRSTAAGCPSRIARASRTV